jgi:CTP:phosphocholine cytidylyltransferase-like protein
MSSSSPIAPVVVDRSKYNVVSAYNPKFDHDSNLYHLDAVQMEIANVDILLTQLEATQVAAAVEENVAKRKKQSLEMKLAVIRKAHDDSLAGMMR